MKDLIINLREFNMLKRICIALLIVLTISVNISYGATINTDFDAIIEDIYGEIEEYDKEINRINNIVDQIENKYCTKEDLIFGTTINANQAELYKDSLRKLTEAQENKFLSIEIMEKSKEFYATLFDSQEKSTLKVIDKWVEQNKDMEVDALRFLYPVNIPNVSSGFGKRIHPIFGTEDFHGGTDFADKRGTNIYASEDGVVIFAQYNQSYGNAIVLMHGNGAFTLYGHIDYDGILVRVGDKIEQGQLIAKMGSTGMSTGPHLHFEIINGRTKIDPLPYLHY